MLSLGRIIVKNPPKPNPLSLPRMLSTLSPPQHGGATTTAARTSAYYDDLVNEAGRSRDFRRLNHLLIKRINDGCLNTKNTFNFITKTQTSIIILDDLFECLANLPNGLPRKSAFDSLIIRLCKVELIKDALQVFDKILQRKLELNATSFHPVLQALTRKKDAEKALRMLEVMKGIGVGPDTTSYNYILTAFCVAGDVTSAVDLVGRMVREGSGGLKGDSRTYDALVLGACRAGKVEGAMVLLRAAVDDGVKLMYCTYAHVIKAMIEMGYYAQVVKFVMSFVGRERGVDRENFELLSNCLIKVGRVEEAKIVVDEMSKRGLPMGEKLRDFYQLHVGN